MDRDQTTDGLEIDPEITRPGPRPDLDLDAAPGNPSVKDADVDVDVVPARAPLPELTDKAVQLEY